MTAEKASEILLELLEKRPDGTIGVGNNMTCGRAEAMTLIKEKKAKHPNCPIGVIPPEWLAERAGSTSKKEIDDNGKN